MSHQTLPKNQYPISSFAREKGMTKVATRMSALAKETKKRFWGGFSALLVSTAITTKTLPTIVNIIRKLTSTASPAMEAKEYLLSSENEEL